MGYYKYLNKSFLQSKDKERFIQWRRDPSFLRLERPTRINRARALGYKAKEGIFVVRAKMRTGGRKRPRPNKGRKPSKVPVLICYSPMSILLTFSTVAFFSETR